MRKNLAVILLAGLLAGVMTGCQRTPEGRMKAGIPLVKDSIENRYQVPVQKAFTAARQTLEFNGTLTSENTISHTLEAMIDTRRVIVTVDEVEPGVTRVVVEARKKSWGADVDMAAEIATQIALRLK